MTFITCLLLSLSAGSATYAAGAIAWCAIDPDGAGARLLFTIPIALAVMAVPGILGAVCLAFRCDFYREPRAAKVAVATATAAAAAAATRPAGMRPSRPVVAAPTPAHVADELDLAFAT
jgi:hypothetical protein